MAAIFSVFDHTGVLPKKMRFMLPESCVLYFGEDDTNHLEQKMVFLTSTPNLIVNASDFAGMSAFTGALQKLIQGDIKSLAVVSELDIRKILIYGDNNETVQATEKLNSGALRWIPSDKLDKLEAYIAIFKESHENA